MFIVSRYSFNTGFSPRLFVLSLDSTFSDESSQATASISRTRSPRGGHPDFGPHRLLASRPNFIREERTVFAEKQY